MSWNSQMVIILRDMIFDTDPSAYTYTSGRLEQVLINAAYWVYTNLDFSQTYTIDVENIDISPDPTEDPVDYDFVTLTCLRATCLVLGSEMKTNAMRAVRVTDGPSTIDMTAVSQNMKPLYDQAVKNFDQAKLAYQVGENNVGKSVLSPYGTDMIMPYLGNQYYGAR